MPSVQECYNGSFDYFTKEDKTGAYASGKYADIISFPDLFNEYFFIDNVQPTVYSSLGQNFIEWHSTDDHVANIYNDSYRVYYSMKGKHYEVLENKKRVQKDFITYSGIGTGLFFVVLLILLISKPRFFKNLTIFGKKWRNTSQNNHLIYFDYSLFSQNNFFEQFDENISRGKLKIVDRGSTINLSYPNKEIFYKIDKVDNDNLILIELKDNTTFSFTRIGSAPKNFEEKSNNESTEALSSNP